MKMIKSSTSFFIVALLLLSVTSKGFVTSYSTTNTTAQHHISYIDPEPMKP